MSLPEPLRAESASAPASGPRPELLPEPSAKELSYAVVDFETRNAPPGPGVVIEVGVALLERGEVTETWGSLVRPSGPVGDWVERLTGITDRMVADAPPFSEIAPKLLSMLEGRIFVAHNVQFDWSMLRGELPGLPTGKPRLCTVRMSRALVPEAPKHSLDAICGFLGVDLGRHHRAVDDAAAAARLLAVLLNRDGAEKWVRSQLSKFRRK